MAPLKTSRKNLIETCPTWLVPQNQKTVHEQKRERETTLKEKKTEQNPEITEKDSMSFLNVKYSPKVYHYELRRECRGPQKTEEEWKFCTNWRSDTRCTNCSRCSFGLLLLFCCSFLNIYCFYNPFDSIKCISANYVSRLREYAGSRRNLKNRFYVLVGRFQIWSISTTLDEESPRR